MRKSLLILFLCFLLHLATIAQPGTLHTTFGNNGIVTTGFPGQQKSYVTKVAQQADGKILAVGPVQYDSTIFPFALVRYLPDGTIDSSFHNGYVLDTSGRGFSAHTYFYSTLVCKMVVQPDGNIVVAANIILGNNRGDTVIEVRRYTPQGNPDITFGTSGITYVSARQSLVDMVRQSNGSFAILTADNNYFFNDRSTVQLVGLTVNGFLNPAFGTGGFARFRSVDYGIGFGLHIALDGKLLVAAKFDTDTSFYNPSILRLTANGSLDAGFGNGGIATLPVIDNYAFARGTRISQQSNGNIILSGIGAYNEHAEQGLLARCDSSGKLDSSFGNKGAFLINIGRYGGAADMAVGKDDKPVIVGSDAGFFYQSDIARSKTGGFPDSTFGNGGNGITRTTVSSATGYPYTYSLCLTDSLFYVGGSIGDSFSVISYINNPALLPVSWRSFTATAQQQTALLQWQTANETNNLYFEIERSTDGRSFVSVGRVNSNGGNSSHSYMFTDKAPVLGNNNYYRLRQADFNGSFSYSKMIPVDFAAASVAARVYPNPVKDVLTLIAGQTISKANIVVTDLQGRVLYQSTQPLTAGDRLPIRLAGLQSQMLIITISGTDYHQTFKVMKE